MIQQDHLLPIEITADLAPGVAWDTIASLYPASAAEELANDFVWVIIGS